MMGYVIKKTKCNDDDYVWWIELKTIEVIILTTMMIDDDDYWLR